MKTAHRHIPKFCRMKAPTLTAILSLWTCSPHAFAQAAVAPATPASSAGQKELPATISVKIPAAAYEVTLTLIPGDAAKGIKPFYLGTTELTWQAFDPYLYRLDEGGTNDAMPANADTTTRPSKPYLPPDRGFGHDGYAAITMSFKNAKSYCAWLNKHDAATGQNRTFRLPTEAEWLHAASEGQPAKPLDPAAAEQIGWFASNADGKTHPVATKKPNRWGLYDMFGNAAEWVVMRDAKGNEKGGLKGGSYLDEPAQVDPNKTVPSNPDWNASDPQIPKSPWWLADGPFIGFRIVCEIPQSEPAAPQQPR